MIELSFDLLSSVFQKCYGLGDGSGDRRRRNRSGSASRLHHGACGLITTVSFEVAIPLLGQYEYDNHAINEVCGKHNVKETFAAVLVGLYVVLDAVLDSVIHRNQGDSLQDNSVASSDDNFGSNATAYLAAGWE